MTRPLTDARLAELEFLCAPISHEEVLSLLAEVRASRARRERLAKHLYDDHRTLARLKVTGGLTEYGNGELDALRRALDVLEAPGGETPSTGDHPTKET